MENRKLVIYFFIKLAIVCAVVAIVFTLVFGILFCKGESMYPRIRDGDVAIYYRLVRDYQTVIIGRQPATVDFLVRFPRKKSKVK